MRYQTMAQDFRALCAELAEHLDQTLDFTLSSLHPISQDGKALIARARAALVEGEAVERLPDGAQIIEPTERTVLVPAPRPIPVGERLPGAGDCDAEGRCWWWDARDDSNVGGDLPCWRFHQTPGELLRITPRGLGQQASDIWTHWLPSYALGLPDGDHGGLG